MLQAAKADLFNPLVPKAHNSECQDLLTTLYQPYFVNLYKLIQKKEISTSLGIFNF